jgi:hypothetical protein
MTGGVGDYPAAPDLSDWYLRHRDEFGK